MARVVQAAGWILDVAPVPLGDSLAVDHPQNATVLDLNDAEAFAEEGGWLNLNGAVLQYLSADLDADTITLAVPLAVAALESDAVHVWDEVNGRMAAVFEAECEFVNDELGDDDSVSATLHHSLGDRVKPGPRNGRGESCTLQRNETGSAWTVVQVEGVELVVDMSFADPETFPEIPETPDVIPGASPLLQITGMPNSLLVRALDVINPRHLIEYHISTDPAFTPTPGDPATLYGVPTRSAVHVITNLATGEKLIPGTPYGVAAITINSLGEAGPPSPTEVGQLDLDAVAAVVAEQVVAGFVLTDRIALGATGAYIDAIDGMVFPQPNGKVTRFTLNGITPSQIAGFILASEGMTVEGDANFYGLTQMFGLMRLASGITDPLLPAAPARGWTHLRLYPALAEGSPTLDTANTRGLGYEGSTGQFWLGGQFFGPTLQRVFTSGAVDFTVGCTGTRVGQNLDVLGYTRMGGVNYFLCADSARNWRRFVFAFDDTGAKIGTEWEFTYEATSGYAPGLGNDGTYLIIATCNTSGFVVARYFTTAGVYDSGPSITMTSTLFEGIEGVWSGQGDFPGTSQRVVVAHSGGIRVYDKTTGARVTSHEFARAESANIGGMVWDGTRFHTLDNKGRVWHYAAGHPTTTTVSTGYTWRDPNPTGGTHETAVSPDAEFSWPARTWLIIEAKPAPDAGNTEPGKTDVASQVRFWAGSAAANRRLQAPTEPAIGQTSVMLEALDTGSAVAPTTSTFVDTPDSRGGLVAAVGGFELYGDSGGSVGVGGFAQSIVAYLNTQNATSYEGAWWALPLASGFTAGSPAPQYRRDILGNVWLRGRVNIAGSVSTGAQVNNPAMATWARPTAVQRLPLSVASPTTARARLSITAAGEVIVNFDAGQPTIVDIDAQFCTV